MNKVIVGLVLMLGFGYNMSYANEWVAVNPAYPPVVYNQVVGYVPQYVYVPQAVVVPVVQQVVPVVYYQNIVVERHRWCLFKNHDVVRVPQIQYVPVRY
jgi:hypothetical protein